MPTSAQDVFDSANARVQPHALLLRQLIFDAANEDQCEVDESIKWGQASYRTKEGSPVRIGWTDETLSLFVNCNTSLIEIFAERYSDELTFVGTREIVFSLDTPLPEDALKACLKIAFSYHSPEQKKRRAAR